MNSDLEQQLDELGPGYRELVNRLVAAYDPVPARGGSVVGRIVGWTTTCVVAASLLAFLGLGFVFRGEAPRRVYTVRASDAAFECLQAAARNDSRLQESLRTNVADRSCSPERRFDIIMPLEYTLLTGSSATERKITEEK